MTAIQLVFELPKGEGKWWKKTIQQFRGDIVKSPGEYVARITSKMELNKPKVIKDVSTKIYEIREACWELYLKDEVKFHKDLISALIMERNLPKGILSQLLEAEIVMNELGRLDKDQLISKISSVVGEFAGRIMPYLYQLSLSTTNSRRSRAGSTFEAIIDYFLVSIYDYPYENQAKIGTKFYTEQNIGKMVDGVIPSASAYSQNRSKCQIITMKTSLRERWQEVVEELNRTNIPHIYLLTLDEALSDGVLTQMKSQNITVVTYDWIKNNFNQHKNVISFSSFFNEEIPHTLEYWDRT